MSVHKIHKEEMCNNTHKHEPNTQACVGCGKHSKTMEQGQFEQVFDDLAPQRRKVLLRLLGGDTDKEIAASLYITEPTVRKHLEEICKKFKCEPDEQRSRRSNLIALFRKYKPELFKNFIQPVMSEGEAVEKEDRNNLSSFPVSSSQPDATFVGRENAIAKNNSNSHKVVNISPLEQCDGEEKCHRGIFIPNPRCRQVWGRDELIEEVLHRLTDSQELPILSLSGSAGYGKTEAASQLARKALNKNLFADVLWIKARSSELVDGHISHKQGYEALDWNKFLDEIARQLSCPVERVRQRLREEKRLVILDNAETAQVDDILANLVEMLNPSRALLTSRLRTKPPYVRLIPIRGLEERWSYRLLRDEAESNNIPVLLEASDDQLKRVHHLSCGAPLALHFIVGRVQDDQALEPVLSALEQASGDVDVFYQFSLNTAWQRVSDAAKSVLRYMGRADAGVTFAELSGAWGVLETDWNKAQRELRRWYLIEDAQDAQGNQRYDLHPWVRCSLRGGLVDNWQPPLKDLEQMGKWMFDIDV